MPLIEQVQINRVGVDRVSTPSINRLPPPVIEALPAPIITKSTLDKPVIDIPVPKLDYPRIEIPTSPEVSIPQKEEKQTDGTSKNRSLGEVPPVVPAIEVPKLPPVVPATPQFEPPGKTVEVNILGHEVNIPTPAAAVEAGATAIIGTSVTLGTAIVFNQARQAAAPVLQKMARDKFRIRLRNIKPVLHFIEENGLVHVIKYDAEGVKLLNNNVENPEQYLRDLIDADHLFEADHKILIDDLIKDKFTKEGAKRFNYFVPAKKLAQKLAARFVFG
jgi:hypothetical protein